MPIHTIQVPGQGTYQFDTDNHTQRAAYEALLAQVNNFAKGRKEPGPMEVAVFLASYAVDKLVKKPLARQQAGALHAADRFLDEHIHIPDWLCGVFKNDLYTAYENLTTAQRAQMNRETYIRIRDQVAAAYAATEGDRDDFFTDSENTSFYAYEAGLRGYRPRASGHVPFMGEVNTLPPEE